MSGNLPEWAPFDQRECFRPQLLDQLEAEVARLRVQVKRLKTRTKRLGNERDEARARLLALEAKVARLALAWPRGVVAPVEAAR